MKNRLNTASDFMVLGFLKSATLFVMFALCSQVFMVYLHFTGQEERTTRIINAVEWKFDGTFKNSPENIWYEGPADKK
jgi:hypothetical protein